MKNKNIKNKLHCQFLCIAYLFTLSVNTKFKFPVLCVITQNGESSRDLVLSVTNRKALAPGVMNEGINLSSIVQDFSPIIYYSSQLSFTTVSVPFSKCMLSI